MQRKTPTKVRSRREKFSIDEIPTKDTSPSISHRGHNGDTPRSVCQQKERPHLRRAVSLDFSSNSSGPDQKRRYSGTPSFASNTTSPERQRRQSDAHYIISHSITPENEQRRHSTAPFGARNSIYAEDQRRQSQTFRGSSNSRVSEHQRRHSEVPYSTNHFQVQKHQRRPSEIQHIVQHLPVRRHSSSEALTEILSGSSTSTSSSDDTDVAKEREAREEDNNSENQEGSVTLVDECPPSNDTSHKVPSNVSSQSILIDFEFDRNTKYLSKGIYTMWRKQRLCDVVFIVAGGAEMFYAHRLVLAITCDTFSDQDSCEGVIKCHIPTVRGETMKEALKFVYTGRIDVRSENVAELLEICNHIRSSKLAELCKIYLLDINMATSVRNRVIAIKYGFKDVVAAIDIYIQDHFTSLVSSDTFLTSEFQIIFDIISSEMLTKPDELQVFHACASWINFDPTGRLAYVVPLMNLIRFNKISPANIVSHVESVTFMTSVPECKNMLYKAFRHHALFRDMIHSVSRQASRSPMSGREAPRSTPCYRSPGSTPPNISSVASQGTDTVSSQIESNAKHGVETQSRKLTSPRNARCTFQDAANAIRNQMAQSRIESQERTPTNPGKKYTIDAVMDQIQNEMQLLKLKRSAMTNNQSVSEQRRESIACGRHSQNQRPPPSRPLMPTSESTPVMDEKQLHPQEYAQVLPRNVSCECISQHGHPNLPSANSFIEAQTATRSDPARVQQLILNMPVDCQSELSPILAGSEPFSVSAIPAPLRPSLLFAMGGINPYFKQTDSQQININQSIQQYVPSENTWSIVTQMPQPVHHFAVTTFAEKVYVTGGQKSCTNNNELPTRDCFVYDVTDGKWEPIALLKTARACHAAISLNGVVYVVGGLDCVAMSLRSMEFYDQNEDKWYFTQQMKEARVELAAVAHRGKILVVGGMLDVDEKLLLNTVEVFDPNNGNWSSRGPFPLYIAGGSMVDVGGVVYYVGGYMMQDKHALSVDSVFRYCDETDNWTGYQALRVPRHKALVCAIGCRIYVVGGESSASLGHALTNVECIDVETNEHIMGIAPLLSPAYGIGGCSIDQ